MAELTNAQLTQLMLTQSALLQGLCKKKTSKINLKELKPAITLEKFIEDLTIIPTDKLISMSLPDYYANTINENLQKYAMKDRPIICSNPKLKKFYYWNGIEWNRTNNNITPVRMAIFQKVCKTLLEKKKLMKCMDETQMCIHNFFDVDKYPTEKLVEKFLIKLGSIIDRDDYESD